MKIFTSDEVGLVKRKLSATIDLTSVEISVVPDTQPAITVIGAVNRNKQIHQICAHNSTITVARRDGSIDVMGTNGTLLQHYKCPMDTEKKQRWVGLSHYDTFIIALLNTGKGYIIDTTLEAPSPPALENNAASLLHTGVSSESIADECVRTFDIAQDKLYCFRMCGSGPLFATGGEERELHVWDTTTLIANASLHLIFKAKNVKNCELDLRVRVWIRDIQFINEKRVVTITEYMHLRVYEMHTSKRPIINITVGTHPLRSLACTEKYAVIGDNCGQVLKIGYEDKKMIGKYQGCGGSVVGLLIEKGKVICVSMDRFLRIFGKDREEEEKIYLKQRLSGLCIINQVAEDKDRESDEEDLWDEMDVKSDEEDSEET